MYRNCRNSVKCLFGDKFGNVQPCLTTLWSGQAIFGEGENTNLCNPAVSLLPFILFCRLTSLLLPSHRHFSYTPLSFDLLKVSGKDKGEQTSWLIVKSYVGHTDICTFLLKVFIILAGFSSSKVSFIELIISTGSFQLVITVPLKIVLIVQSLAINLQSLTSVCFSTLSCMLM